MINYLFAFDKKNNSLLSKQEMKYSLIAFGLVY